MFSITSTGQSPSIATAHGSPVSTIARNLRAYGDRSLEVAVYGAIGILDLKVVNALGPTKGGSLWGRYCSGDRPCPATNQALVFRSEFTQKRSARGGAYLHASLGAGQVNWRLVNQLTARRSEAY